MSREVLFITTRIRSRAVTLALLATVGLTVLKLSVGMLSNSVGVLSEAVHSFLDLVSAAVSFFTIKEAGKPADSDHPFGHEKIETLSSLFESLLLAVAAVLICYEGVTHLIHPEPIQYEGLAIVTILVSIGVSYLVYRQNLVSAQQTDSSAIHVNALHFLSDVVASSGVLVGLVLLKLTGWLIIDPLIAFAVAGYILVISATQVKKALLELSDTQLPDGELKKLREILETGNEMIEAHEIRTRKSGATRHIDFHLVLCKKMTVEDSHAICDRLEVKIAEAFPRSSVNIHVEPCEKEHPHCHIACPTFQKERPKEQPKGQKD